MKGKMFYALIIFAAMGISCSKDNMSDQDFVQDGNQVNKVKGELVNIYVNAKFGKTKSNTIKVSHCQKIMILWPIL